MLKEISVEGFARFLSERRKYEKEREEKDKDDAVDITPASYLVSMSPLLLKTLWPLKDIDFPEFDVITSDHMRQAIENNVNRATLTFLLSKVSPQKSR